MNNEEYYQEFLRTINYLWDITKGRTLTKKEASFFKGQLDAFKHNLDLASLMLREEPNQE